jgi:N-methylhydantoinase B/oxoprolinase/acetone carboxylase alpha subunit
MQQLLPAPASLRCRKASQQAKSIEHAHIAADAAAAAAVQALIDAAGDASLGAAAADQIEEAAGAAAAAAVPAGTTKRKHLAAAEADADTWQQQYGELYEKRHEQPQLLPLALKPFAALADRRAQAQLAGTAKRVTDDEVNAAAADMQAASASTMEGLAEPAAATLEAPAAAAVTSRQRGTGSLVASWFSAHDQVL